MPLNADFWLTDKGREVLAAAPDLSLNRAVISASDIARLRKLFPDVEPERISEALGFAVRMKQAEKAEKLPADVWLFTQTGYEQSTAPVIAAHHASRFAGCSTVVEICTGAGCDTLALSRVAEKVVTIEADANTAALARTNFSIQSVKNIEVITATAEDVISDFTTGCDGLWADPARRTAVRRVTSPNDYQPPLQWLMNLSVAPVCGIKISPALTLGKLPPGWVREWIGYSGECREQVLWRGIPLENGTTSIVDAGVSWTPQTQIPEIISTTGTIATGGFILEPHAALIRSGFLSSWFAERSVELLDSTIAYGYSSRKPDATPFASVFEVISAIPFSYKRLQESVITNMFTKGTEIKKRGFPEEPDEVRSKLQFTLMGEAGVIILTRHRGERVAILCCRRRGDAP